MNEMTLSSRHRIRNSRSRRLPTILTFTRGWGRNMFCFFQTAETGNRATNSGVKGSGANHYPRGPAQGITYQRGYIHITSWPTGVSVVGNMSSEFWFSVCEYRGPILGFFEMFYRPSLAYLYLKVPDVCTHKMFLMRLVFLIKM